MPNITLNLNQRDGAVYAQWARWMLGVEEGPWGAGTAMRAADKLYQQESVPIRRVAKELWRATQPHLAGWTNGKRELYRGLRHVRADLDGRPLPWDTGYAGYSGISYSEDIRVACYFADPGKRGMPGIDPMGRPLLPPNGYILKLNADGRDVLFHWRWLLAVTGLFGIHDPQRETPTTLIQQEVTIRNDIMHVQRCHDWQKECGGYIGERYKGDVWEPGNPDPWADDGGFGAFDPKVIQGERDGHWLARRIPDRADELQEFRRGFEAGLDKSPPRGERSFIVTSQDIMEHGLVPSTHAARLPLNIGDHAPSWRTGYSVGRESRGNAKQIAFVYATIRARIQEVATPSRPGAPRRPGARVTVRDVAHIFANSDKPAKASALHTDGTSCWSYAKLIAQKRRRDRLDNVCYVEKRKFSKTTSKHQSFLRGALVGAGWKLNEVEFP